MKRKASSVQLGKVQLEIMKIMWDRGSVTAREITDALSEQEPIAHSTVQTLLRTLEDKGVVVHESQNRVFFFKATCEESEITTSTTHDLLTRVFHGSPYSLVSHLLKHEKVSKDELARLRQLIEQHTEEGQP